MRSRIVPGISQHMFSHNSIGNMSCCLTEYKVGDTDARPWGTYVVTGLSKSDDGTETCEKEIVIYPSNIMSLQSHCFRAELWEVLEGTLTVIVDGSVKELGKGDTIDVPVGAVHCMANLQVRVTANSPVTVVKEVQTGICREEDIVRYIDMYGRSTVETTDCSQKAGCKRLHRDVQGDPGENRIGQIEGFSSRYHCIVNHRSVILL